MLIFSTASYILSFNLSPEDKNQLQKFSKTLGVKYYNANDFNELVAAEKKINFMVFVIINLKNVSMEDTKHLLKFLIKPPFNYYICNYDHLKMPDHFRDNLIKADFNDSFLNQLYTRTIIEDGKKVIAENIQTILDLFFKTTKPKISETSKDITTLASSYSYIVECESSSEKILTKLYFLVKKDLMKEKYKLEMSEDKMLDFFREITNQSLGVINQKLSKVNHHLRIFLPNVIDLSTNHYAFCNIKFNNYNFADDNDTFILSWNICGKKYRLESDILPKIETSNNVTDENLEFF